MLFTLKTAIVAESEDFDALSILSFSKVQKVTFWPETALKNSTAGTNGHIAT